MPSTGPALVALLPLMPDPLVACLFLIVFVREGAILSVRSVS